MARHDESHTVFSRRVQPRTRGQRHLAARQLCKGIAHDFDGLAHRERAPNRVGREMKKVIDNRYLERTICPDLCRRSHAAPLRLACLQQRLQLLHDFGMLEVEVGCFAGIVIEVVKLAGRVRHGVRQRERFEFGAVVVVSAGAAMIEVFPRALPDARGRLKACCTV